MSHLKSTLSCRPDLLLYYSTIPVSTSYIHSYISGIFWIHEHGSSSKDYAARITYFIYFLFSFYGPPESLRTAESPWWSSKHLKEYLPYPTLNHNSLPNAIYFLLFSLVFFFYLNFFTGLHNERHVVVLVFITVVISPWHSFVGIVFMLFHVILLSALHTHIIHCFVWPWLSVPEECFNHQGNIERI